MDPVVAASPLEAILQNPGPWLCWILPMLGALSMPILGRINNKVRDYGAVAWAFMAVLAAGSMIPYLFSGNYPGDVKIATWINFPGGAPLDVGVLVDALSVIICNVVAFISFLIVVYSTAYMHGDEHLTRFWFFFLFFVGSMLLLVIADNLVMTMVGWEGVGMCSYGLIGYYYRDAKERWLGGPAPTKMYPPSECGMKAFVVTGVGDVFILGAIFIIFNFAGTLNYHDLIQTAPEWLPKMASVPGLVGLTAILFLGGPIGKSAQFPLHEWLPEAMAGPTSVSALIHAATMVKAGVYLVARMSPVFYIGTWFLHIAEAQWYFIAIALVGAFTCFLAASQALVSVELKKILAYSTVSQIGYMMLGLGLSGFSEEAYIAGLTAGIFHLASHALFKAALFLCAGSVIHALESIYIFNMGGLKKHMPKTYLLMLLATMSLSGIPPFSGFWSKDAVFLSALVAGTPLAMGLLAVGVICAAMTFAYSIRFISKTFLHEESEYIHDMEKHGHHVHEAPTVMWGPIAILVGLFIIIGLLGLVGLVSPSLSPEIFIEERLHHAVEHILPLEVAEALHVPHIGAGTKITGALLSFVALAVGGFLGYNFYWTRKWDSWAWVQANDLRKSIHTFLWNRWYMNSTFYAIFVYGLIDFGKGLFNTLESLFFDKLTAFVSSSTIDIGKVLNVFETKVYDPALNIGVVNVFVNGGKTLFKGLETDILDEGLNRGIPAAAKGLHNHVKKFQTGVLSYNIIYMVVTFLVLILGFALIQMYGGI
ncbi:MAG TPA: NADH-quinone oxidoreductase subunit L [Patescibacteria group bacterium]|nr:NADH-quinone oxidoreductase subunit L [Patescibacteria group bacterium]